jgi:hypothetical protein
MTAQISDSLPLPAHIFHAAMQRQLSLDAYAATLAIPEDALRALVTARADQLSPEVAARLAAAHGQPAAELAPPARPAEAEAFCAWLERQMEGASQSSLRARAQLDARLLRAFLSGKALPDADQAERLARALYVDGAEMASVIVADMAGRATPPQRATAQSSALPGAPAPARVRRRQGPAPAPAETPALPPTPRPAQSDPPPAEPAAAAAPPEAPGPRTPRRTRALPPPEAPAAAAAPPEAPGPRTPRRARAVPPPAAPAAAAAEAPEPQPPRPAKSDPPPAEPAAAAAPAEAPALPPTLAPPGPRTSRRAKSAPPPAETDRAEPAAHPSPIPATAAPLVDGAPAERPGAAAADTPLELAPDEVRLLRGYRRLHPHGRRATLQYIGSLLVEEELTP